MARRAGSSLLIIVPNKIDRLTVSAMRCSANCVNLSPLEYT
jgi:hypothetical protein